MSSSGRYQSRLFSFFSQQSLRLKDRTGQAWRQIKLAAVWGTQIALYPIYALFQTGRLLDRQMGQAARHVFPRLRTAQQQVLNPSELNLSKPLTLDSDTPIQNLLAESRGAGLAIQGFASLLPSRALVLVTVENEALDMLTEEQQRQLQRQIIWEIASYWHQRKIQPSPEKQTQLQGWPNTFLPLPKERTHLLPPIRSFRRLMTWVQLSPVAIAINLFQESRLVALPSVPDPRPEVPLRSAQLPGSRVSQVMQLLNDRSPQSGSWLAWVRHRANRLAELSKSLGDFLQNSSMVLYDPSSRSEPEDFSVGSLPLSSPVPPAPPKPWLKIGNFFGGKLSRVSDPSQIVKRREMGMQGTATGEAIAGRELEEIAFFDSANELTWRSPSTSAVAQPAKSEGGIASTVLEAEVTGVSYEKHPLEQLLKWLDQGMLWIEQKLGQIWHWFHRP